MKFVFYFGLLFCISSNIGYSQITLTTTAIKSSEANSSGLSFKNLNSNSPTSASNGKTLSVDAAGNVILTLAPGVTTSYWQLTGDNIANTNPGAVKIVNLQVGNSNTAVAGMIRWTGTDLQGYAGSTWKSLISAVPQGFWLSVDGCTGGNVCVCPTGYKNGADESSNVCKDQSGTAYKSYFSTPTSPGSCFTCSNASFGGRLAQCYCVKLN